MTSVSGSARCRNSLLWCSLNSLSLNRPSPIILSCINSTNVRRTVRWLSPTSRCLACTFISMEPTPTDRRSECSVRPVARFPP